MLIYNYWRYYLRMFKEGRMIMLSNKARERFVSDYSLPIQLYKGDYFDYFVNLYDEMYGIKEKLVIFEAAIDECGSEDLFFEAYYKIRDNILSDIKANPAYDLYNNIDMNKYGIGKQDFSTADIFKPLNHGKNFVSIDLVKANYQVMKLLDESLVFNSDSYQEMIGQYATGRLFEYMSNSKYLRQVIFGNLNPKRQTTMQKYYTFKIINYMLDNGMIDRSEIEYFTFDEIVISGGMNLGILESLKQRIKEHLNLDVKIECFELEYVEKRNFYVKKFDNGNFEFKALPVVYFAQAFKEYYNLPIVDNDKRFLYEKKVAQFVE